MTHIKLKYKIKKIKEEEIEKRMRKDKVYYHCCNCGEIYEDKHMNILIVKLTTPYIPKEFKDYVISSGGCSYCMDKRGEKKDS